MNTKSLVILSYAAVYIVWGSTYYAIKLAVADIPPYWLVSLRFLLGGMGLLIIAAFRRELRWPGWIPIGSAVLVGLLLLLGGNGLVTLAEKRVDSYLAALVIATTPMFVLVESALFFGKKTVPTGWLGVLLGLGGVALLLYDPTSGVPVVTPGVGILLAAVLSWSLGTTLGGVVPLPKSVYLNMGLQMFLVGTITFIPLQFLQPGSAVSWGEVSIKAWMATAYLVTLGTAALGGYYFLLKTEPPARIVTYAFVNPVIAVTLGLALGKEIAAPWLVPGLGLILLGLMLMFYGPLLIRRFRIRVKD